MPRNVHNVVVWTRGGTDNAEQIEVGERFNTIEEANRCSDEIGRMGYATRIFRRSLVCMFVGDNRWIRPEVCGEGH